MHVGLVMTGVLEGVRRWGSVNSREGADSDAHGYGPRGQTDTAPPPVEPLWGATNLHETHTGIGFIARMKSPRLLYRPSELRRT